MPTPLEAINVPLIEITTELSRIDLDRVHHWLARKSHWAGEMPRAVFERAVSGSLCFAALEGDVTVGFARVISDRATFAYLCDVFVDHQRRGMGIGKRIVAGVLAHAALQAEPSIGLLLPCNVVVRSVDGDRTRVETIDPAIMVSVTGNSGLQAVASEARTRLTDALRSLEPAPPA